MVVDREFREGLLQDAQDTLTGHVPLSDQPTGNQERVATAGQFKSRVVVGLAIATPLLDIASFTGRQQGLRLGLDAKASSRWHQRSRMYQGGSQSASSQYGSQAVGMRFFIKCWIKEQYIKSDVRAVGSRE